MIHPLAARATHLKNPEQVEVLELSKNLMSLAISKLYIPSSSSSKTTFSRISKNLKLQNRTLSLKITLSRKKQPKVAAARSLEKTKIARSSD